MKSHKNLYTRYILLERTMVQFLCMYLAKGRFNSVFFLFFSKFFDIYISACGKWNCKTKLYTRYILLKKYWCNLCVHTSLERRCNSIFSKIFLIVISWLLLHGITQSFIWNIRTARDDIDINSVIIPL